MDIRNTILHTLSDGTFHSGEKLAEGLGITRAAISNHIKGLQQLGLDVFSVTGKGYKLAKPLSLLSSEKINKNTAGNVKVENVIDSTNQYVRDNAGSLTQGAVCLAEAQTAGRGRLGRKWQSPFGANLYLSMLWRFESGYQALDGLSLVIGLAVARAIETIHPSAIQLKWPNDILFEGRKLGGVLIEVDGQFGGACDTVIGVGLNIAMPEQIEIDQPWVDLQEIAGMLDRNAVAVELINTMRQYLTSFEGDGFASFTQAWNQKNAFKDKSVTLLQGNNTLKGLCRGIDERGGLLIEENGACSAYYGGEISVRAND